MWVSLNEQLKGVGEKLCWADRLPCGVFSVKTIKHGTQKPVCVNNPVVNVRGIILSL